MAHVIGQTVEKPLSVSLEEPAESVSSFTFWIYKKYFMTERVTGLKFHTLSLGLGRDMTDSKKFVR